MQRRGDTSIHVCAGMTGAGLRGGERVWACAAAPCCPQPPLCAKGTARFPPPLPEGRLTLPVIGSWGPKEEVVAVRGEGGGRSLLAEPKLIVALGASLTELPLAAVQLVPDGQVLAQHEAAPDHVPRLQGLVHPLPGLVSVCTGLREEGGRGRSPGWARDPLQPRCPHADTWQALACGHVPHTHAHRPRAGTRGTPPAQCCHNPSPIGTHPRALGTHRHG